MIRKIKKLIAILTILLTILMPSGALAFEVPSAPTPPPQPELTQTETAPTPPPEPTAPPVPETPTLDASPTPTPTSEDNKNQEETASNQSSEPSTTPNTSSTESNIEPLNNVPGPQANGNVSDTAIDTGDATATGTLTTSANNNTSTNTDGSGNSTVIGNIGNGSDSDNWASLDENSTISTIQNNTANVDNSLTLDSDSGSSSASGNVGNTTIQTGDSNTSGTVVTKLNSNLAGLTVSEFNVVDDQLGDFVLDFASSCIIGCDIFGSSLVENSGNGSDSDNNAILSQDSTNNITQNNTADLENNLLLTSNSGNNTADANTGGDTIIQTGDSNISASVASFLNNNIAGQVLLGVVNIFGDLIGDIILPSGEASNTTLANTGNGSGSINTTTLDQAYTNNTYQTNDAEIINNLNLEATTGDNVASKNTGGNTTIETGDANVLAQILNIANSNISGGNWWLVLVNEAGEWVGKIIGAADGNNFAGSEGTDFDISQNGDITVKNIGNGSGSDNTAAVNQSSSQTMTQNNDANIVNNINLSANSGGNSASKNTGGNTTIKTGDANVVANLINFVNNNIVGAGKLTVVTINVFGKWLGDFVGPGQEKETKATTVTENSASNATSSNNQNNSNSDSKTSFLNNSSNDSSATTNIASTQSPSPASLQNQSGNLNSNASYTATPGGSFIAGYSSQIVDDPQDTEVQVAGVKIAGDNSNAQSLGKKITLKLNLAWLLLIIPLGTAAFVINKKRTSAMKQLLRRGRDE